MGRRTNRRQFIQQTALAGVGFWAAGGITRADDKGKSANERVNIACIGVGGKGDSDSSDAGQVGNVVAICDVDKRSLQRKASQFPNAKPYSDFRKMFDEMGKGIDAVTVSTPDHTHAVASLMAMNLGKHVYCQKPLTHDVWEARQMRLIAEKMGVQTQMGNQGTANRKLRDGVDAIRAGVLGPVHELHVWTNRPVWPQAPVIVARPKQVDPVPDYLDWELWLGTAPTRPYCGQKQNNGHPPYHDFNWRGWWDFGTGALGDMACHTMNMPFMALKFGYPTSIVAECGDLNNETYPSWATVTYQFPARGNLPAVKMVWYEGQKDGRKNLPPMELLKGEAPGGSASLIIGEKASMYSPADYGERWQLLPREAQAAFKAPEPKLPRFQDDNDDLNQKKEWVAAIKGGPPALSNFGYAGVLAETILLGNIAIRVGKKLEWNGENMKFTNVPEAEKLLRREYRNGWSV